MNNDFRSQTTTLQTAFPFKGKGVINDRLRLDVSGLAANTEYVLSYDTTTHTFAWSTPAEVTGIDTLYSADGEIAEARTVTLDAIDLNFEGVDSEFNIYLEDTGVITCENSFTVDGFNTTIVDTSTEDVTISNVIGRTADEYSVTLTHENVDADINRAENFLVSPGTLGYTSTLSGAGITTEGSLFQVNFTNVASSDNASLLLRNDADGGALEIAGMDASNSWTGSLAMGFNAVDGITIINTLDTVTAGLGLLSEGIELTYENSSPVTNSSIILGEDNITLTHASGTSEHTVVMAPAEISINFDDGTSSHIFGLGASEIVLGYNDGTNTNIMGMAEGYVLLNNLYNRTDIAGAITGTGGVDVVFPLPSTNTIYNANVMVTIICTDAGNGVGLTAGEAFVGWYGAGINKVTGTPAMLGTAQALATAQADTHMADAAVTFTAGNDPDVLNVHIEGPSSAGTTSVFAIKVSVQLL